MKHICQTIKPGDYLTKFDEEVKRREKVFMFIFLLFFSYMYMHFLGVTGLRLL